MHRNGGECVLREEKKAEKRQELVGVCLDCFVEKGLTVATTKDLCKAAKLQNGGIYYYFSTKEEIVLACAEEAISRIEKAAMAEGKSDKEVHELFQKVLSEAK